MSVQTVIKSQYLASLEMLRNLVVQCPDPVWADPSYKNEFWRVVYHALFYTHLYLQPCVQDFVPWARHTNGYHRMVKGGEPYRKEEILEYFEICQAQVEALTPNLDLEAPSGFDWLPLNKLELQFYTIRHIQQHVGELSERLGGIQGIALDWVDKK